MTIHSSIKLAGRARIHSLMIRKNAMAMLKDTLGVLARGPRQLVDSSAHANRHNFTKAA
jgi:hypothetical protein